jgi:hypothetical protein
MEGDLKFSSKNNPLSTDMEIGFLKKFNVYEIYTDIILLYIKKILGSD